MEYPIFSIVIATYNSQKTLVKTLESLKKQDYPQNKIDILAIDGGSTDKTIEIAKKYKCKILKNPKVDLVYAKHIGYLNAKGKYLLYIDHDEILENPQSLKIKLHAFLSNPKIKSVMPTGYKTPQDYSPINYYANEFGDPFSFFIYRESKGDKYLIRDWSKRFKVIAEDKDMIVYDLTHIKPLPLIELWAGACTFDLEYTRANFPEIIKNPDLIAHIFYLLNQTGNLIAITKNDPTIHYSSESVNKFFKKMKVRIKNNIYYTDMGRSGYLGRENFQPKIFLLKKYLFIPYTLLIIPPLLDALYLTVTRKKLVYMLHLPLCLYITFYTFYYLTLKLLGFKIIA